jgi:hypothetical protein
VIRLRLRNVGAGRRISYLGWGKLARDGLIITLRDNRGRSYPLRDFGPGAAPAGQVEGVSLLPGKYVDDLLVFEPPAFIPEYLRLELPASAFGGGGSVRWHIPRSMLLGR